MAASDCIAPEHLDSFEPKEKFNHGGAGSHTRRMSLHAGAEHAHGFSCPKKWGARADP